MQEHRPKRPRPPTAEVHNRIVAAVGEECSDFLRSRYGGRKLYISTDPRSGLVKLLGVEKAKALFDAFGHDYLVIPFGDASCFQRRRADVATLSDEGLSGRQIAERLGCHSRTVERVRHTLREIDKLRMAK